MPSLAMYPISPTKDEKEFEHILLDFGQNVYGGQASLFGRKGQAQHGIDVVVNRLDGSRVCIQCKDYISTSVTTAKIDAWIAEAEQSAFQFQLFVIAVAAHTDARLQEYVFRVSDQRMADGKFPVNIIFWEDIEHFIKRRPELLKLYYPMLYHGEEEIAGLLLAQQQERLVEPAGNSEQQERFAGQAGGPEQQKGSASQQAGMPDGSGRTSRLVMSEAQLRGLFLDEVVKYRIQEMLRADPFVGFSFDLVVDSDCFEYAVQNLLDRAIGISASGRFMQIDAFRWAFSAFGQYLSRICEMDQSGMRARYSNLYGDRNADARKLEELRRAALEYLQDITNA